MMVTVLFGLVACLVSSVMAGRATGAFLSRSKTLVVSSRCRARCYSRHYHHQLAMAPRFDTDAARWIPSSPEEEASAGYGPTGSLLRQGPIPFAQRISSPDDYDQAVLKFMAGEDCTRDEAQASMDAYLRNPADWAYFRKKEEELGIRRDYLTLRSDKIVLTSVWSVLVVAWACRQTYCLINHDLFWDFLE